MRNYLVILILIFSTYAFAAQAADVLLGTVRALDIEKGEILVNVIDSSAEDIKQEKTIVVKVDPKNTDFSNFRTGKLIRVWGRYVNGVQGMFEAQSVSKRGVHGRKNDPTGVRSRLGRGHGTFGRGKQGKGHGRH